MTKVAAKDERAWSSSNLAAIEELSLEMFPAVVEVQAEAGLENNNDGLDNDGFEDDDEPEDEPARQRQARLIEEQQQTQARLIGEHTEIFSEWAPKLRLLKGAHKFPLDISSLVFHMAMSKNYSIISMRRGYTIANDRNVRIIARTAENSMDMNRLARVLMNNRLRQWAHTYGGEVADIPKWHQKDIRERLPETASTVSEISHELHEIGMRMQRFSHSWPRDPDKRIKLSALLPEDKRPVLGTRPEKFRHRENWDVLCHQHQLDAKTGVVPELILTGDDSCLKKADGDSRTSMLCLHFDSILNMMMSAPQIIIDAGKRKRADEGET